MNTTELQEYKVEPKFYEGNKVIAAFMGAKKSKIDGDTRYLRFSEPHAGTETYAFYPRNLKYHTSWDWLRPVIEKIGDIADYNHDQANTIYDECGEVLSTQICVSIEVVWDKIVEFITWYNSLKQ